MRLCSDSVLNLENDERGPTVIFTFMGSRSGAVGVHRHRVRIQVDDSKERW